MGQARALLAKAGARAALGDATVVALAGATGSGKSTLFNALCGARGEHARGAAADHRRRPRHRVGPADAAAVAEADRLLDWLEVPRRHRHPPEPALDGLVLLDLPDHDSVRLEHRLEVDRLVGAGRRPGVGAGPGEVRRRRGARPLPGAARRSRRRAARRAEPGGPARSRGRGGVPGRPAHAARPRGAGPDPAARGLGPDRRGGGRAARRAGAPRRRPAGGHGPVDRRRPRRGRGAPAALPGGRRRGRRDRPPGAREPGRRAGRRGRRAGGDRRGRALDRPVRHRGDRLAAAALDPEAPARSARAGCTWATSGPAPPCPRPGRSSGPGCRRRYARRATRPARASPRPGGTSCGAPSRSRRSGSPTGSTGPWPRTELGPDRVPLWQRAVGGLQWLLAVVALVGALWLLALVLLGFFQLDDVVPLPRVEGVPLPTLLLIGGLLAGLLLAVVARPLVALRARRRARAAERRLRAAIEDVAEDEVLAPMAELRSEATAFCAGRGAPAGPRDGVSVQVDAGGPWFGQPVAVPAPGAALAARRQPRPDVLAAGALLPAELARQLGDQVQPHPARARGRGRPQGSAGARAPRRSGRAASRPDRRRPGPARRRRRAAARWRPAPRRRAAGRRGRPRSIRRRPTGGRRGRGGRSGRARRRASPRAASARRHPARTGPARTATRPGPARRPSPPLASASQARPGLVSRPRPILTDAAAAREGGPVSADRAGHNATRG